MVTPSGPGGLWSRRRPRSHRRQARWPHANLLVGLVVLATVTVTGSAAHPPEPGYPPGPLPIATGDRGTVFYTYGYALMDAVRRDLPDLGPYLTVTPSSQRNVELVSSGAVAVAFASADAIARLPVSERDSVRVLARLYEDYLHLVVREHSGISSLTDLRGKRVSIGLDGSGTQTTARQLLAAAGVAGNYTPRTRGLDDSIDDLRENRIDAFFFFGGVPTTRLAELRPFRLIDLEDWIPRLGGYGVTYSRLSIPASEYHTATVTTVGAPNYLIVSRDMDPDLAYALTALLYDERDAMAKVHPAAKRLDRRAAINARPLLLHPGAVRYYRDTQV